MIDLNKITFRPLRENDLLSIADIYNQGIDTGYSTFDEDYVRAERYSKYVSADKLGFGMIVAEYKDIVIGWSSIEPKSERKAYRYTCLGSTYMHKDFRYVHVGKKLIDKKFQFAKELGYHSIIGEILSINEISLNICYDLGYQLVGEIKEAGYRNNEWIGLTIIQRFL